VRRTAPYLALALTLAACASGRVPTLEVNGYSRVPIPRGCYRSQGEHNVQLTPELEIKLVGLLRGPPGNDMCWHERRDATLLVTIGSECGPHREAEFQRQATMWTLKIERDVVGECFVHCDGAGGKRCAI